MKEDLEAFLAVIARLGGDSRSLIWGDPANEQDILELEQKLGFRLPEDFRNVLLTMTAHCEFKWFLPDDFPLPHSLREIFRGELHWSTDFLVQFNEDKDGWVNDVFPNIDDEYDKVWHNKFVFQEVGNGDFVSIDRSPENVGKIIYLSHDDGEGHGYVMANSFQDLLSRWPKLGCVGAEDWQWLPFCKDKTNGIDPDCEHAQLWYTTIGLTTT